MTGGVVASFSFSKRISCDCISLNAFALLTLVKLTGRPETCPWALASQKQTSTTSRRAGLELSRTIVCKVIGNTNPWLALKKSCLCRLAYFYSGCFNQSSAR
jgi:hypothetical protein